VSQVLQAGGLILTRHSPETVPNSNAILARYAERRLSKENFPMEAFKAISQKETTLTQI
jgi:hypothetical protein